MWTQLNNIVSMYNKPSLGSKENPIMALVVDPSSIHDAIKKGIARKIISRKGSPDISGYLDKSQLILVESENLLDWKEVKNMEIRGIQEIIEKIKPEDYFFIGLEDPDIIIKENSKHVFFTIAFRHESKPINKTWLGHARGSSLNNMEATDPVLEPMEGIDGFKEIAQMNSFSLSEALVKEGVSAIAIGKINPLHEKIIHSRLILDPRQTDKSWCNHHVSPCRIVHSYNNSAIMVINGRELGPHKNDSAQFGKFRPGLILIDSETGEIKWIDKNSLFEDPEATTITFASDFVKLNEDLGILYAHINDSFVRTYKISLNNLKEHIKNQSQTDPYKQTYLNHSRFLSKR